MTTPKTGVHQVHQERFRVKTRGYVSQFSTYNSALSNFERLKSSAAKKGESFKVTLENSIDGQKWTVLDEVKVTGSFFD